MFRAFCEPLFSCFKDEDTSRAGSQIELRGGLSDDSFNEL